MSDTEGKLLKVYVNLHSYYAVVHRSLLHPNLHQPPDFM